MPAATEHEFEPRVRFNWGFHDATLIASRQSSLTPETLDPAYLAGYSHGTESYRQLGYRAPNSQSAWEAHTGNRHPAETAAFYSIDINGVLHSIANDGPGRWYASLDGLSTEYYASEDQLIDSLDRGDCLFS